MKKGRSLTHATFSPAKVLRQIDTAHEGYHNITRAGWFWSIQTLQTWERVSVFQIVNKQGHKRALMQSKSTVWLQASQGRETRQTCWVQGHG